MAFAQQGAPDLGLDYANSIGLATTDIRTTISRIINAFLGLIGIVLVGIVIYAGFIYMTAGGDETKVQKAKGYLVNAAIGLAITLSAFAITAFIFRAITGSDQLGTTGPGGTCPPGQTCGAGIGGGGAVSVFKVAGVSPAGQGGLVGFPRNSLLSVLFTADVNGVETSVNSSSFVVKQCNKRLDGNDVAQFDDTACADVVPGTLSVQGKKIVFTPTVDGENLFEADFWYLVTVSGATIKDTQGRPLSCPFASGSQADPASPQAKKDLCSRAMAIGNFIDTAKPVVRIQVPVSPPSVCGGRIPVQANATDDGGVATIEYRIDGGTAGLIDASGEPTAIEDGGGALTFNGSGLFLTTSGLSACPHTVSVVATDVVGNVSVTYQGTFTVLAAACCNGVKDANESAVDCGGTSQCGACTGSSCTNGSQCQSGSCSAANQCEDVPVIESVSPLSAGPGSFVTISGHGFGSLAGRVVFLGGDTDGNGDPKGDADDVDTEACASQAWSPTQVVVAVPANAVTGPIELRTATSKSDRTDRAPGFSGPFTVTTEVRPGICFVDPNGGVAGAGFTIHGSGFGSDQGDSRAFMDTELLTITQNGWSQGVISAIVPSLPEGARGVRVRVGGIDTGVVSNTVLFTVRPSAASASPRIVSISPGSGPVGATITIQGSGFGTNVGKVSMTFPGTNEIADLIPPVCADFWHDNFVIVKIPERYRNGVAMRSAAEGIAHTITITTATGKTTDPANFKVNTAPSAPAICKITPDNGPAGKQVEILGEGFGTGPAAPTGQPKFSVEFFAGQGKTLAATAYSLWSPTKIVAVVPGDIAQRSTWPQSGPVTVIANGFASSNTVPFTVQNCHDNGVSCSAGTQCCGNGVCAAKCDAVARDSVYGWQLSTAVIPSLPVVVERQQCDADLGIAQSPSPFKGETDACVNASFTVEFNKIMVPASFSAKTVLVDECGQGETPICVASGTVPLDGKFVFVNGVGSSVGFLPAAGYNGGLLKKNTWYRITLVSQAAQGLGVMDEAGRFLDGDRDGVQGGSYQWAFKSRDSVEACALSKVIVNPSRKTIDHQGGTVVDPDTAAFRSLLTAANCNVLQCRGNEYSVAWSTDAVGRSILNLLAVDKASCPGDLQRVTANSETDTPVILTAAATQAGQTVSKSGDAEVLVKFADPVVTEFAPSCVEACVNSRIFASFNIPMDQSTLTPSNVELFVCRDEACNPPYDPIGQHLYDVSVVSELRPSGEKVMKGIDINVTPDASGALLTPDTNYIVRLKGGANGIKSSSGALLSGLNNGEYFVWKFKTKKSSAPCTVSRAEIQPKAVVMSFVGEKAQFRTLAFGSPDACSARGQQLVASEYDWQWSKTPGFIAGFIVPRLGGVFQDGVLLDTASKSVMGCSDACILTGSQSGVSQCGNGKKEFGEACDDGNVDDGDGCSSQCIATGTAAGVCGNGVLDVGETCETIKDQFPLGCKNPAVDEATRPDLNGVGCVKLGSLFATGSRCGSGTVTDGEDCDDRNTVNGDGCNANCLFEGSKPSCSLVNAAAGVSCVNLCGNNRVEAGEDPSCDVGAGPAANGCSTSTCLKIGTSACGNPNDAKCCGNGVQDLGEDEGCDPLSKIVPEYCTARCTLKGASLLYSQPSACGDGLVGVGESPMCDGSQVSPDLKMDAIQAVEAGSITSGENASSTIVASVREISRDANKGTATVSLSCTCRQQADPQAFCGAIGANHIPALSLGCSVSGCCAEAPHVLEPTIPANGSDDQCRNAAVRITFDQKMDLTSLKAGAFIGEESLNGQCADGQCKLPVAFGESEKVPGFFARTWNAVVRWFSSLIGRDVSAATPPAGAVYCAVAGEFRVQGKVVTFAPKQAFAAQRWHRIFLDGKIVKAANTVGLNTNYNSYFRVGDAVCKVGSVTISPSSHLFNIAEDLGTDNAADENDGDAIFLASAHPQGRSSDEVIESTPELPFKWNLSKPVNTSPIEVRSKLVGTTVNGFCEQGESGADCAVDLSKFGGAISSACGNEICEAGKENATNCPVDCAVTIGQDASAIVNVRTGSTGFPRNGEEIIRVTADVSDITGQKFHISATSDVVTLLCENPWPARRVCRNDRTIEPSLPWDPAARCDQPGQTVWYPFYDKATNVQFFYCRDTQRSGDEGEPLPALKENIVRIAPGRDILFEYLFTFATPGPWSKDAIGLRVTKNLSHLSVAQWYAAQGFRGQPRPTVIDGNEALLEGRTVYVSAPTLVESALFTNVNTFSFSDGAASETVSVFNRMLDNVDTSRNVRNFGFCINSDGSQFIDEGGNSVGCRADRDCQINVTGEVDEKKLGLSCLATKSKIVRDSQRWSTLMQLRSAVLTQRNAGFPKLDSGTYLRSQSVSTWPSWTEVLASAVGRDIPEDPLNAYTGCAEGADPETCFNASSNIYQCPVGSHVYQYQSVGGVNFRLSNDFEGLCHTITNQGTCNAQVVTKDNGSVTQYCRWTGQTCTVLASWKGSTCIELDKDACVGASGCVLTNGSCNFLEGEIAVGGVNAALQCANARVGQGGVCGDGLIQGAEQCEPGQPAKVVSCEDKSGKRGSALQGCTTQCTLAPVGECVVGQCGDGKQDPGEFCDDGTQNGQYGFCNAVCSGLGERCGDGVRQVVETCDCPAAGAPNGTYTKDAVLQSNSALCSASGKNAPSCATDCAAIGPRCGDGVVNGAEECDGGFQTAKGFCSQSQKGCATDGDCGVNGGKCQVCQQPDQTMRRSCQTLSAGFAAACTFGEWTCSEPGFCGNGIKEVGEECDDNNAVSTDACIIDTATNYLCRTARCGDGYVQAGVEQCDKGGLNGQACIPQYGRNCEYCSTACKTITVSGGFCGDGILQSPQTSGGGAEECEVSLQSGTNPYICVGTKPEQLSIGVVQSASCNPAQCTQQCGIDYQLCLNQNSPNSDANSPIKDTILDVCDPDKDNDGVPAIGPDGNVLDCNDYDINVHPSYAFGTQTIAAGNEVCDAGGKDENCDGIANNLVTIKGSVTNLKSGALLNGATVRAFCNGTQLGSTVTANNGSGAGTGAGTYTLVVIDPGTCGGQLSITADKTSSPAFCFAQSMTQVVNIARCGNMPTVSFALPPQPLAGSYDVYVRWTGTASITPKVSVPDTAQGVTPVNRLGLFNPQPPGNIRGGTYTPQGTESNKSMLVYIEETTGANVKPRNPIMEIWRGSNVSAQNCTLSTVDSVGAPTSTGTGQFWHGFNLVPSTGNRTPVNKFSSTNPAFNAPTPPSSGDESGKPNIPGSEQP